VWRGSCLFLLFLLSAAALVAEPSGAACTANAQCAKDEFCAKFFGSCEGNGKCEPRPTDCTEHGHMIVKPVCGCDDRTYDNFCLAAIAGANVKHEGKCAS
jgi:hypothetical protein